MNLRHAAILALTLAASLISALGAETESTSAAARKGRPSGVPPVVHSQKGDSSAGVPGSLRLVNIGKLQQFAPGQKSTYDTDIHSPKSATFSADGRLFYINSLEGCRTVAYDAATLKKQHVVEFKFPSGTGELWGVPSGFYPFTHYKDGQARAFQGKPVESTWTHGGRYLWVPFYRRTFDINAQDPSAVAVIDTRTHSIVRLMETGPLPKMIATSPDGRTVAITHWGDNTVGFVDVSSDDPTQWHHLEPVTVGYKLQLNFPMNSSVNRDSNSGYLLRGTVFTPDGHYLLVSAMAGPLAVIDARSRKFLGTVGKIHGVRHLAISDGMVYGSCNTAGSVIRFPLDSLITGVERAVAAGSRSIPLDARVETCKVGGGARTLELSPDGKYIFVACNSGNAVYVVDAATMKVADHIRCDSYPVGLAISPDGRRLIVTSQGRKGYGGNAVNIFEIKRPDLPETVAAPTDTVAAGALVEGKDDPSEKSSASDGGLDEDMIIVMAAAGAGLLAGGALLIFYPRKKDNDKFNPNDD